jgi:hypothetical protein
MRGYASQRDCDQEQFQSPLTEVLAAVSTGGPVARAVLLQLQAATAAAPTPAGPLQPGDDVAAAVAAAASAATVQLSAARSS